ncbi:hypothetical protein Dimus_019492 [Dionaea muscipula]
MAMADDDGPTSPDHAIVAPTHPATVSSRPLLLLVHRYLHGRRRSHQLPPHHYSPIAITIVVGHGCRRRLRRHHHHCRQWAERAVAMALQFIFLHLLHATVSAYNRPRRLLPPPSSPPDIVVAATLACCRPQDQGASSAGGCGGGLRWGWLWRWPPLSSSSSGVVVGAGGLLDLTDGCNGSNGGKGAAVTGDGRRKKICAFEKLVLGVGLMPWSVLQRYAELALMQL